MNDKSSAARLIEKSTLHAIQVELQQGYNLSPVEAMVLAQRLQQLVAQQQPRSHQPPSSQLGGSQEDGKQFDVKLLCYNPMPSWGDLSNP